ncbi:hypothetical protein [Algoriphagus persicinus]|uniref:hypothetical protein n=1 Tax=Algoriphagus persicinus TaxID=3108754 RepID=UPI002B365DBE|nr:hypothetical protein [Algoriphagus sp. E1-3-M2]MEB2784680.1 hypothetical protein [Algoriphagus sp. E1-3-M2]
MGVIDFKGERYSYKSPGYCPHCHRSVSPTELWRQNYYNNVAESNFFVSAWLCPDDECRMVFIVEYDYSILEEHPHAMGALKHFILKIF